MRNTALCLISLVGFSALACGSDDTAESTLPNNAAGASGAGAPSMGLAGSASIPTGTAGTSGMGAAGMANTAGAPAMPMGNAGAPAMGTGGMMGMGTGGMMPTGGAGMPPMGVAGMDMGAAGVGMAGMGMGDPAAMSFFVTSDTSMTGNLGGLIGADQRCQALATAVGSSLTWRAYLSTTTENARDRIGTGPWFNALGVMVAADVTALHALTGDFMLFIDETGMPINGQWAGSPAPVEHDVLTGSNAMGMLLMSATTGNPANCDDWTSAGTVAAGFVAQVGHSDGLGQMMNAAPPNNSWNSSHESGGCDDTAPRGGAGRLYCFAL